MKKQFLVIFSLLVAFASSNVAFGQAKRLDTDANLFGHVVSKGQHVPGVTIVVKGTTIGTATDRTGHYRLLHLPEGDIQVQATCLGYRTQTKNITINRNETLEINFDLEEDLLNVDAVVITGDKDAMLRREASTIINTVTPKLMSATTARTISEGLPFIPGVRMENNCQNCGFNQVRLNGMGGEYSQVLVDGHPIFSGLMGVYGMELIPSNMIERIEVQRGGGSSLYGSNAIAGTINLILQDPMTNSFDANFSTSFIGLGGKGKVKPDYSVSFNSSNVTEDNRTGLAVYGNYRSRAPYDYDNDGYSELPRLRNATIGTRLFQRLGGRGKLSLSYFHITEDRRGGNKFDNPPHMSDICEQPKHSVNVASAVYTQLLRENDQLNFNASMQHVNRESFYGGLGGEIGGAQDALSQYGVTKDITYNIGGQYTAHFSNSTLIAGFDVTGERLYDAKPEYAQYTTELTLEEDMAKGTTLDLAPELAEKLTVVNQATTTVGGFAQYSIKFSILQLTAGIRCDRYSVKDNAKQDVVPKGEFVAVPRASLLVNILPELQMRANYSMGYRAPQLYNEELHVELAGVKQVRREVAKNLTRETSHSAMLSFDYNHTFEHLALGVLVEGFYTHLQDAFISREDEDRSTDDSKVYIRDNYKPGANIMGANFEVNIAPSRTLAFKLGGTFQSNKYVVKKGKEMPDELNSGQIEFLKTPNVYGFLMANWKIYGGLSMDASLNITGPMRVLYEWEDVNYVTEKLAGKHNGFKTKSVEEPDLSGDDGALVRQCPTFADMGLKLNYEFKFKGANLNIFTGIKNIFDSFQKDFDDGATRSSSYVYGPMQPRTFFVGLRLGNVF